MDFQELADANHAALYRFALSLTKSEDQAADLVQQTFYRWAAKGQALRDPSRAKSWLFTTLTANSLRLAATNRFCRKSTFPKFRRP